MVDNYILVPGEVAEEEHDDSGDEDEGKVVIFGLLRGSQSLPEFSQGNQYSNIQIHQHQLWDNS